MYQEPAIQDGPGKPSVAGRAGATRTVTSHPTAAQPLEAANPVLSAAAISALDVDAPALLAAAVPSSDRPGADHPDAGLSDDPVRRAGVFTSGVFTSAGFVSDAQLAAGRQSPANGSPEARSPETGSPLPATPAPVPSGGAPAGAAPDDVAPGTMRARGTMQSVQPPPGTAAGSIAVLPTPCGEPPGMVAALHRYWLQLGGGQAPERRQIDPAALKPLLPYLELIEFEKAPFRIRYRLTGTQIDRWNGRNLTGHYLDEFETLDRSGSVAFLERRYAECAQSGTAFVGCYDWPRPAPTRLPVARLLERLAMPPEDVLPNRLRIWVGAFPLRVGTEIRQCLVIEDYEGLPQEMRSVPWMLPTNAAEHLRSTRLQNDRRHDDRQRNERPRASLHHLGITTNKQERKRDG